MNLVPGDGRFAASADYMGYGIRGIDSGRGSEDEADCAEVNWVNTPPDRWSSSFGLALLLLFFALPYRPNRAIE
jgi:hypothetical protein